MAQSILYYPTIDINNEKWLKSAILYWDEVCSIVPWGREDILSDNLRFLQEKDQYRAIYPGEMFDTDWEDEFSDEVIRRMRRKAAQLQRRGRRNGYGEYGVIRDSALYQKIHYRKIPAYLFEYLERENYIRVDHREEWVEMREDFSMIYMKTLAEYLARSVREDMIISTDRQRQMDNIFGRTRAGRGTEMISLTLADCLPVPREDVSFEDLIDFKEHRKDDLYELRVQIRELEKKIHDCRSHEELKSIMNSFKESWQKELIRAEKLFQGDRIPLSWESFQAFIGGASDGGSIYDIISPEGDYWPKIGVAVASGIFSVAIQQRNYRNKINENKLDPAFAYIIGAQQNNLLRDCKML